jgi:hypothetical protein
MQQAMWEMDDTVQNRVASFTPLPVRWPHALGPLSGQISVVETPTFEESEWKTMFNLRGSEEREILESSHWLCIESDCKPLHNRHTLLNQLAPNLRTAMLGFQIWAPKGWTGIIVNSEVTNDGIRKVLNANLPRPMRSRGGRDF